MYPERVFSVTALPGQGSANGLVVHSERRLQLFWLALDTQDEDTVFHSVIDARKHTFVKTAVQHSCSYQQMISGEC